jgi:hypothetical protein
VRCWIAIAPKSRAIVGALDESDLDRSTVPHDRTLDLAQKQPW